jgi:peptidase M28-like protein
MKYVAHMAAAALGVSLAFAGAHILRAQMTSGPATKPAGLGLPRDHDKLVLPDDAYPRFPLLPGQEAYKDVDGLKIKAVVKQITAISDKSRDAGDFYWGRITGTPYDRMTTDWMLDQFRKLGLENVRRDEFTAAPLWYPTSVSASYTGAGKTEKLSTLFPIAETKATPPEGITADAVWLGLGTEADFIGRDVKGKAAVIYSVLTPGGRNHSAGDRSGAYDSINRANKAGAAMVITIMGMPGNALFEPEGADRTTVPSMTISQDEGYVLRDQLGAGQPVKISLKLAIEERQNLKSANVFGTLPGMSDEQVFVMAHTDAFFEGAMDNASGMAMLLDIARHYAALPKSARPRTMVFAATPDHHHGSAGLYKIRDGYDWSKVAFIVNCEHPSQTLLYLFGGDLMTSNAISARRWYANGTDAFRKLVYNTLRDFNVSVYTVPESNAGGSLGPLTSKAPAFHIIDHVIYHTTLDTPDLVPAWGLEDATRGFLKIIDSANKMTRAEIGSGLPAPAGRGRQ